MYPTDSHDPTPRVRRRRRRVRGPIIVALSASLLGMSAVTTASAASDGKAQASGVTQQVAQRASRARVTAAPAAVTGVAEDGTPFTGKFTVQRFTNQQGTLYAVGQLVGTLGDAPVAQQVSLPVTAGSNDSATTGTGPQGLAAPSQATPGACSILTLDLGPIDLNLLGLRVFLDEVHLLIEAIPGAGNLLGNLLCAVAGLLDGGLLGGPLGNVLNAIVAILNSLLGV